MTIPSQQIATHIAEVIDNAIPSDIRIEISSDGVRIDGRRQIDDEHDIAREHEISLEDLGASKGNLIALAIRRLTDALDLSEAYYRTYPEDIGGGMRHIAEFELAGGAA